MEARVRGLLACRASAALSFTKTIGSRAVGPVDPDDVFLFTEHAGGYSGIGVWVMSANGPYVIKSYVERLPARSRQPLVG